MQEWIIAMLAVSILTILRDMAKTVLKGRKSKKRGTFSYEWRASPEGKGGTLCSILSETGGYVLWDAL